MLVSRTLVNKFKINNMLKHRNLYFGSAVEEVKNTSEKNKEPENKENINSESDSSKQTPRVRTENSSTEINKEVCYFYDI